MSGSQPAWAPGSSMSALQNGYVHDPETRIHHIVLNALVETAPEADCFGWLDLFEDDTFSITGVGRQDSYQGQLRPFVQPQAQTAARI